MTQGLGKQSVLELARHEPKEIWLTARTSEKAENAIKDIKKEVPSAIIKPLEMDLSSFDSIKSAARTFTNSSQGLDILMLNAGCMATPPELTKDGYELQFGTNHLGHALFTKLLTPSLEKTASQPDSDVRVVVLSSAAVAMAPQGGIQLDTLKTTQDWMAAFTERCRSQYPRAEEPQSFVLDTSTQELALGACKNADTPTQTDKVSWRTLCTHENSRNTIRNGLSRLCTLE